MSESRSSGMWERCPECDKMPDDLDPSVSWTCANGHEWEADPTPDAEPDELTDREAMDIELVLSAAAHDQEGNACMQPWCPGCQSFARGWEALYRTLPRRSQLRLTEYLVLIGVEPPVSPVQ